MKLGDGKGRTQQSVGVRDLLTGDELNDDETGAGWGDDDDLEDWGSLEDGKSDFNSRINFGNDSSAISPYHLHLFHISSRFYINCKFRQY